MKFWLILMMTYTLAAPMETMVVDRIEGDYAVIEVTHGDELIMADIPTEDFNNPIAEGNKIFVSKIRGEFASAFEDVDGQMYYHFKSYDDSVWWVLTAKEIGFTPDIDKKYTLTYYNNGTIYCDECPREFDCDCEVYDDIFLAVFED